MCFSLSQDKVELEESWNFESLIKTNKSLCRLSYRLLLKCDFSPTAILFYTLCMDAKLKGKSTLNGHRNQRMRQPQPLEGKEWIGSTVI